MKFNIIKLKRLYLITLTTLFAAFHAKADIVWTGGAADNNFWNPANWTGGAPATGGGTTSANIIISNAVGVTGAGQVLTLGNSYTLTLINSTLNFTDANGIQSLTGGTSANFILNNSTNTVQSLTTSLNVTLTNNSALNIKGAARAINSLLGYVSITLWPGSSVAFPNGTRDPAGFPFVSAPSAGNQGGTDRSIGFSIFNGAGGLSFAADQLAHTNASNTLPNTNLVNFTVTSASNPKPFGPLEGGNNAYNVTEAAFTITALAAAPSPVAPTFTAHPVKAIRYVGGSVTFTAAANGYPAPQLQWEVNNTIIPDATNATLTLSYLQLTNAGSYVLTATNTAGGASSFAVTLTVVAAPAAEDSVLLFNPSFEQGWTNNYPGYLTAIPGWNLSISSGLGINNSANIVIDPFWDNGALVDSSYVAFLQGNGTLGQPTVGLQVGQTYWLQFFANSRSTTAQTNFPTINVFESASTSNANALVVGTVVTPVGLIGTAGTGNPFTFINVPFTAATNSGDLNIQKGEVGGGYSGNGTLLLDGFSIIRRTTNDIVVANPSFEAAGLGQASPGYVAAVAGWTKSGAGGLSINQQAGPFADNGVVPEGANVLGLQGVVGIRQTLHGLTPGNGYQLTLYLNGRAYDAPNIGHSATALITVDGNTGFSGTVNPTGAAGIYTNSYQLVSVNFLAASTNATVEIDNQDIGGGASALLVDNVRVLPLAASSPVVLAQPADAIRYVGGTVTFTAAVFGFPTPQLQWKFNNGISTTSIAGATNQTLTISNLQLTNAGSYALYATNSIGATNSSAAALSLVPAPDSAYAHAVLANNPIGYWRFSDGGGTNAYDYVGNHTAVDANYMNNGNGSSGTPAWLLAGPQSPAFPGFETTNTAPFLDGLSQGYASSVGLFNNRSNFTLMGWFNLDPSQYPISNDPWAHAGADERASLFGQEFAAELGFYHGTNLYFFATGISGTIFVTNGFAPGQWEFVAVVSDTISNTTTVYLNGAVAGTASACPGTVNSYLFSIGKNVAYYPAGGYDNALFPGSLDEVAAFDHPLAAAQIQALYNTGLGISSVNQSQTNITVTAASGQITLAWPQDHTGWVLEAQTNALNAGLGTNWARIPSSATTNRVTVPVDPSNPTVYYRLVYP